MGTWSVSTSGENYIMEHSNGFKRSIRKNQVIKSNTYLGTEYASSQSPNLVLALVSGTITSFTAGVSPITFTPDGSNGWDVTALLEPTSFTNIPDGLTVDSTHFDIDFWSSGLQTTIFDNTIATDQTENTGANGAGVYYVEVTYNFSDGTAFVVYGYYLVDATNTILKSVVISGVTVNSVTGLVMDIEASVVQTNCTVPYAWLGVKADNSFYVLGSGDSGTFTLQPNTAKIVFLPLLEDDPSFADYDGDPTAIQTIIIS